jgi:hypothetical protein
LVDLAIIAILVYAAVVGYRRGFVVPMVAQFGTLFFVAAILTIRAGPIPVTGVFAALGVMAGGMAFTRVGNVVASYVHQFKSVERFDKGLGAPLGIVTAAVTLYVVLAALFIGDAWLAPLRDGQITSDDVAFVQGEARDNPLLGSSLDPGQFKELELKAADGSVSSDEFLRYDSALSFFEWRIRPHLIESRIVPVLLILGERAPVIGKPVTLPGR